MPGDNDRKSGNNRFGRTTWDFVHENQKLVLLIVGIIVLVLSVFFIFALVGTKAGETVTLFGIKLFQKPPITVPLQPPVTPQPTVISANTLDEIRETTGVRELRELEGGLNLTSLPNGVFGFVPPWMINTDSVGVGGTGFDRLTLSRKRGGTGVMEIHKSSDAGQIYVIGYVSQTSLVLLQNQSRNEAIAVILFFEFYQGRVPIAIPKDSIIESDNRSIDGDDGQHYYVNDMKIR